MSVTLQLANNGLQYLDSDAGGTPFIKTLAGILFSGTAGTIANGVSVTTGGIVLILPASLVQGIYIKNASSVNGPALKITATPNGGSSEVVDTLDPGGVLIRISPSNAGGWSAITLTGVGGTASVEFILVG